MQNPKHGELSFNQPTPCVYRRFASACARCRSLHAAARKLDLNLMHHTLGIVYALPMAYVCELRIREYNEIREIKSL